VLDEIQQRFVAQNGGLLTQAYSASGCRRCHHLGYDGRVGIFELLTMSDALHELIMQRAGAVALYQAARAGGMQPLVADGLAKVAAGVTTIDEVLSLIIA
jgi:type II secretory ATPase GspE/PulE/Tfp pilus assembly ATPase PilB-like protein